MQDDAYALLIQCFIRNSERSGYILNSEVYDAISDILVKDLVFIAINKENGLTIEVPFCCLYPYEGEVVDICLDRNAYRRDDSKNLPVGLHDDRFVWRLKRPEENSPDIKPIKFISAYHTKEYCLVIETTADRKEYDFHRVLEYYPECSFDSFTIKEYSIIFEHGPEISYLDFHKYIQYKFIQLMG